MLRELQVDRAVTGRGSENTRAVGRIPYFVDHPSFRTPEAVRKYDVAAAPDDETYLRAYMPDEVTRDLARHMHYAAFRWREARTAKEVGRWRCHYYALRDRIILGNRGLSFRAARQGTWAARAYDDLIGECDVVLIQAVAAYNPWLGIRFSTYAFTCLMRALARKRCSARSVQPLSPEAADEYALARFFADDLQGTGDPWRPLLRYFCKEDSLLSEREKSILQQRYQLAGQTKKSTLEAVGRDLGISKERVRQLLERAVGKLRRALLGAAGSAGEEEPAR